MKTAENSAVLIGYATFPDAAVAEQICERLVSEGLMACANLLPEIKSIYVWNGRLEKAGEAAVIFKTGQVKTAALKERFRELHPYRNPALVFWKADGGAPDFLNWVRLQTL